MKEGCRIRMSVAHGPTLRGPNEPPAVTMFKKAGFDVHSSHRGSSATSFEVLQQELVKGTTDCILASGNELVRELAAGVFLAAVFPRQSARLCLVAAPGKTHATPANPVGLEPGATVAVPSLGQQSQLLALCPDLEIVQIPQGKSPGPAIRSRTLDAALIPAHEINSSNLEVFDVIELREELMLPPPGEGTSVIVTRSDDPLGERLNPLDDREARRCLRAETMLAEALGQPAALACFATTKADEAIRLQATLPRDAPDPRSALTRVGAVAATPEAAAELCRFALEECLR